MTHRERQFQRQRDAIYERKDPTPPAPIKDRSYGPFLPSHVDFKLLELDADALALGYHPSTRKFKHHPPVPQMSMKMSNGGYWTTGPVPARVTVTYSKGQKRKKSKPLSKYAKDSIAFAAFP